MPCPDAAKLTDAQLEAAAKHFNALKDRPMLPAMRAHEKPKEGERTMARDVVDEAVREVFGLPKRAARCIAEWRKVWVREPSVCGWAAKKGGDGGTGPDMAESDS